jgi:hypothetical protein
MGNLINTWALDMYPIITKRFQDKYEDKISLIKKTIGFDTIPAGKGLSIQEEGIGGYGYIPDYNGDTLTELNQSRGFKVVYTPKEKAGKITSRYKYAITDISGEAKKIATKALNSIYITQVRDFYNLFANGWSSSFVGGDSVSLFNASHPVNNETGADVFSNTGTTAFSVSAITATETLMSKFKTFDGTYFDCNPDLVLVPPDLESKCKQFFGENSKLLPETAYNDSNPVGTYRYEVIKGLSAKQWILADSMLLKEYMKMVELTKATVLPPAKQDNPLVTIYVPYCDYVMGWSDTRMIYGHNPA